FRLLTGGLLPKDAADLRKCSPDKPGPGDATRREDGDAKWTAPIIDSESHVAGSRPHRGARHGAPCQQQSSLERLARTSGRNDKSRRLRGRTHHPRWLVDANGEHAGLGRPHTDDVQQNTAADATS